MRVASASSSTTAAARGGRAAVLLGAVAALVVLGAGCTTDERRPTPRKTHLGTLPAGARMDTIAVADVGGANLANAWAAVAWDDEGARVVGSIGAGPTYARCDRPRFAPGSARVFYWALEAAEGEGDERIVLMADGRPIATDVVAQGTVVFSDDGARWAALGVGEAREDGEPGALRLIVDGAEVVHHPDVSIPVFGRDGRMATLITSADGATTLVADGAPRRVFEAPATPCAVEARAKATPPDLFGRHTVALSERGDLLIVTRDADGWGIYRNDARLASYPLSTSDVVGSECGAEHVLLRESVVAAARAPVAVWWEQLRGEPIRWRMMREGAPLDDVVCDDFLRTQPPELGPDGRHVAYGCVRRAADGASEDVFVVQDGVRHGPYRQVWGIALSGDGRRVAYGAWDGSDERGWGLYVDGVRRPGRFGAVWRPRLDTGGVHLAWQAQPVRDGRGVLGIDRWQLAGFDAVLWGPEFDGAASVAWVVRRGRRLVRIDVPLADLG